MNEATTSNVGGLVASRPNSSTIKQIGNGYIVNVGYGELNTFAYQTLGEAFEKIRSFLEPSEEIK